MARSTADLPRATGYGPIFRTAFARSANPMLLAGLDRRIVAVNRAGEILVARPESELIGEPVGSLLDDRDEAMGDAWRRRILGGESAGRRRLRCRDGSRVLVLAVCLHDARPQRDGEDGRPDAGPLIAIALADGLIHVG